MNVSEIGATQSCAAASPSGGGGPLTANWEAFISVPDPCRNLAVTGDLVSLILHARPDQPRLSARGVVFFLIITRPPCAREPSRGILLLPTGNQEKQPIKTSEGPALTFTSCVITT